MESFEARSVFNDDFVYFYADRIGPAHTVVEAALLEPLAGLAGGEAVLDLCCGQGRLAEVLASAGARVIGLDSFEPYLLRARSRRADLASRVAYLVGDVRALPFCCAFDLVVCWYTSFGYFDDDTNRRVLGEIHQALRPGGRLLLDLDGKEHLLRSGLPTQVRERGEDLMVEQFRFDPATSRVLVTRTVVRDGAVARPCYFVRVFDEAALRDWLATAGFENVEFFGDDGATYRPGSRRMVVRAWRGGAPGS